MRLRGPATSAEAIRGIFLRAVRAGEDTDVRLKWRKTWMQRRRRKRPRRTRVRVAPPRALQPRRGARVDVPRGPQRRVPHDALAGTGRAQNVKGGGGKMNHPFLSRRVALNRARAETGLAADVRWLTA